MNLANKMHLCSKLVHLDAFCAKRVQEILGNVYDTPNICFHSIWALETGHFARDPYVRSDESLEVQIKTARMFNVHKRA